MLTNSSLQPWFDYGAALSHHSGRIDLLAALPPIQPCYGGTIGGELVNCSVVCENLDLLFDPQHPDNLITCGLWATVGAGLSQTGQLPATTPFDAVGLNVSSIEATSTVGFSNGGVLTKNARLQSNVVSCFAAFYAAIHSPTHDWVSAPKSCSTTAVFQYPFAVKSCLEDLCSPRTLNADFGGIGVRSGTFYSAPFAH